MTTKRWHYAVTFGLQGCYMPDSHFGHFTGTTKRELVELIKGAIEFYDLPKCTFAQANTRRMWGHIKRHGSSSVHVGLYHKAMALEFHGMTEAEFAKAEVEDEA